MKNMHVLNAKLCFSKENQIAPKYDAQFASLKPSKLAGKVSACYMCTMLKCMKHEHVHFL